MLRSNQSQWTAGSLKEISTFVRLRRQRLSLELLLLVMKSVHLSIVRRIPLYRVGDETLAVPSRT